MNNDVTINRSLARVTTRWQAAAATCTTVLAGAALKSTADIGTLLTDRFLRRGGADKRLSSVTTVIAVILTVSLSACGDSSNSADTVADTAADNAQDTAVAVSTVDQGVNSDASGAQTTADDSDSSSQDSAQPQQLNSVTDSVTDSIESTADGAAEESDAEPPMEVTASENSDTVDQVSSSDGVVEAAPTNGVDVSGGDDDSPTRTESLSLQGPFIKDQSRSAGPPSVPQGLTMLLAGHDWVDFSWAPSADDQSVEGYDIYRDGARVFRLRGDGRFSGGSIYEFDYKSWITTSYMDCNYTRYPGCTGNQPASGSTHDYSVVAIDNEGMRSGFSPEASFSLPRRENGSADLTGYNLVFDEEFNSDSLDRNRWKTVLPWGPDRIINSEQQYFVNIFGADTPIYDPFVFTGETLKISGIPTPPELRSRANNQPYLSGVLTTADNFEMTYGYVEMRARLAGGNGILSTFFLFNQNFDKNQPEIDIVEYIGSRPDKVYQTYHYYNSNRSRYASGEKQSTPTMEHNAQTDLSAGFHTYSVLWEPELVIWYVDGIEANRIVGPRVSDEPMNIIAQLVLGSEWIGNPQPLQFPVTFEIDYIKAWQR